MRVTVNVLKISMLPKGLLYGPKNRPYWVLADFMRHGSKALIFFSGISRSEMFEDVGK